MDLDRHHQAAWREVSWCLDRLRMEDPDQLYDSCAQLGAAHILHFVAEQRPGIRAFMALTPARRNRYLKDIPTDITRHAFLIAVTYVARCGFAWLQLACDHMVSANVGTSSRQLLDRAASAAIELDQGFPTLWPFDDGSDPFAPDD